MSTLLAIGLFLAASAEQPAATNVYVTLEPPVIPFHRQARYCVVVEAAAEANPTLPDMAGQFGGLEVKDVQRDSEPLPGGRRRIRDTYALEAVLAAVYPIGPAKVTMPDGSAIEAPSPALRVRALTEEETAAAELFAPNAGLVSIPKPLWLQWPFWLAVAAVAALVAWGVRFAWGLRGRAQRKAPPPQPWEVAYARLRELDQRKLPQAGKAEAFYVDLSAILRYYIEDRFLVHAPEQTTPEFLDSISSSKTLTAHHQRLLGDFLRHCDRVKFAQYEPTLAEMERSFEVVLRFVDDTVPQPEPVRQEAAA